MHFSAKRFSLTSFLLLLLFPLFHSLQQTSFDNDDQPNEDNKKETDNSEVIIVRSSNTAKAGKRLSAAKTFVVKHTSAVTQNRANHHSNDISTTNLTLAVILPSSENASNSKSSKPLTEDSPKPSLSSFSKSHRVHTYTSRPSVPYYHLSLLLMLFCLLGFIFFVFAFLILAHIDLEVLLA